MTPPQSVFHALLRPAVLQILRAAGYQGTRPAVLDSLTDLAVRYFYNLCQVTAIYATHNESENFAPTIVDVRMALQHVGALLPEKVELEQEFFGMEDTRGTDDFMEWVKGPVNKEIRRVALDGIDDANNYLNALKMKHSKTDDDSKYMGTLLGKLIEHGDIIVEGGEFSSISHWEERLKAAAEKSPEVVEQPDREESEAPSSGLSSLGDRTIGDEMELDMGLS